MGTDELTAFFQHPYYRLNKLLLCLNGQWSYQEKSSRIFFLAVSLFFHFTGFFSQIQYIVIHRSDWLVIISTMGPLLSHMLSVVNLINSIYYADKIRHLLLRMFGDWHAPIGPEATVLARHANDGRRFTLMYTVLSYSAIAFYVSLSTMQHVLIVNGWSNLTATSVFAVPLYFTAYDEDHYIFVQAYAILGIYVVFTTIIAVDGMFVVFIQHACGIFAAISYRLEHLIECDDIHAVLHPRLIADEAFWTVVDCIKKHNEAINYAGDIDSAYSWSFASMLVINMLGMSFTGVQVMSAASPDSISEALQYIVFIGSQMIHLFFQNLFCQKLTDRSFEVSIAITRSKWYLCSMRTRVLLRFMLMRSATPWEMKAAKLFSMSMANFSAVIRTSVSYLTILASME